MEPSHSTPDPRGQKAVTGPRYQAVVGKADRNTETERNTVPPQTAEPTGYWGLRRRDSHLCRGHWVLPGGLAFSV